MANEKTLHTRLKLKYDSLANWNNSTISLLPGEIAIATVAATAGSGLTEPVVMIKVGEDGVKTFKDISWNVYAKASDVYTWAKEAALFTTTVSTEVTDGDKTYVGNAVTGVEWDATLNGNKGGLKFTKGTQFATKAELDAALDAFGGDLDAITDNDTRYSFAIGSGSNAGKLAVTETKYVNGAAEGSGTTTYYDFITPDELTAALNSYYTIANADAKFVTGLAEGGTNGTIKAVINGVSGADVKVHGLGDAAYTTVSDLNSTAKGYADAVLGNSNDQATANTVYGAKAAAAAAQSDATIAKTKIETFLGTITPDGSQDIIDTLTEINNYVGEHGEEFAALSEKVTKIENGTTSTTAGDLTAALETEIKGYTVANAEKLNGQAASYYATAESVTNITKENGIIDNKIANKMDKVSMPLNTIALFDGEGNVMGTDWTINPDQHYLRSSWGDDFIAISMRGGFSIGEVLYDENDEPVNTSVNYDYDSINFKTLDKEGTLTYPNKSGTIAITDDIQTYTAAPNGGLKVENNAFSIDENVTFIFDCGGSGVTA